MGGNSKTVEIDSHDKIRTAPIAENFRDELEAKIFHPQNGNINFHFGRDMG
jgi:hypothetical protein